MGTTHHVAQRQTETDGDYISCSTETDWDICGLHIMYHRDRLRQMGTAHHVTQRQTETDGDYISCSTETD